MVSFTPDAAPVFPAPYRPSPDEEAYYPPEEPEPPIQSFEEPDIPPFVNPEHARDLEHILKGGSCVKTYPGTSQYTQHGISACGLASFNAARCVLGLEKNGCQGKDLLYSLMERDIVDETIEICSSWTSSAHLEVEEIYELPMFRRALHIVDQDYAQTQGDIFIVLLRRLRDLVTSERRSAAAIITKPPEIITVFCVATGHVTHPVVFVVFDSHSRPNTHPHGTAFTFFGSLGEAGRHLSQLLSVDPSLFGDADMQWQAQLLSQFSAHYVVATDTPAPQSPNAILYEANIAILEAKASMTTLQADLSAAQTEITELRTAKTAFQESVKELRRDKSKLSEELMIKERELKDVQNDFWQAQAMQTRQPQHETWGNKEPKGKAKANLPTAGPSNASGHSAYIPRLPNAWNVWKPGRQSGSARRSSPPREPKRSSYENNRYQALDRDLPGTFHPQPQDNYGSYDPQFDHDHIMALQLQQEMQEQEIRDAALAASLAEGAQRAMRNEANDAATAAAIQRALEEEDLRVQEEHARLLGETFNCTICMDEQIPMTEVAEVEPCGHQMCRDCLHGHISALLGQGKFPIVCPDCSADKSKKELSFVSRQLAEMVGLTEEESMKWWQYEMAGLSIVIDCRKCCQSSLVDKDDHDAATLITCPLRQCSYTWCKKCSQEVVPNQESLHSCDGSKELDRLIADQGWKKCPGCQTPTERTIGCNHMTCGAPGCNTHFCYIDGALIITSANAREVKPALDAHYSGGCMLFDVPAET